MHLMVYSLKNKNIKDIKKKKKFELFGNVSVNGLKNRFKCSLCLLFKAHLPKWWCTLYTPHNNMGRQGHIQFSSEVNHSSVDRAHFGYTKEIVATAKWISK